MKTVAVIQARQGSTRLPGKIFKDMGGMPVLSWVVRAAKETPGVDEVIVATSTEKSDDAVEQYCSDNGVAWFRGSENDVLERMTGAARQTEAGIVMRLTADCPLLDPSVCGAVLRLLKMSGADYATNCDPATWPDGLDCEVTTMDALEQACEIAQSTSDREHVTPWIRNNQNRFQVEFMRCPLPALNKERWTLDDAGDLAFLQALAKKCPKDRQPSYSEVLQILENHPEYYELRKAARRNEGMAKSLRNEDYFHAGYDRSNKLIKKAEQTVPLGSQTFSKSRIQFPEGQAPLFLTHGRGGVAWDVDGNRYVDLVSGLLPNVLGYCDQDVDAAISRQLSRGISFSMATELEMRVAEKMREHVPCAEMTRFGKNGTDATSAAIRLARAFTGREHVIACGYHGWQDWYIGATTRSLGVPVCVRELTHRLPFNDLPALEKAFAENKDKIAAIIMEPLSVLPPSDGYLKAVKELAHKNGALLVFDEIISGFRIAMGGAQSHFGVTPDLASFGKAMANGMPLSAVTGRADIMGLMKDIFYSGTFGGEALSLAACLAVFEKMEREPVIKTLWDTGGRLAASAEKKINDFGLKDVIKVNGLAPWKVLAFSDHKGTPANAIKTCFLKEVLRHGALIGVGHNVCYAHNDNDIAAVERAYDAALSRIAELLNKGNLTESLGVPVIQPVFQVRG